MHETLGAKLLAATAETDSRRRQIEAMRREDEAKLRAARSENEALRDELEAMITGAKRTDIGLVITRVVYQLSLDVKYRGASVPKSHETATFPIFPSTSLPFYFCSYSVSYTHLTLPTNREV